MLNLVASWKSLRFHLFTTCVDLEHVTVLLKSITYVLLHFLAFALPRSTVSSYEARI